MSKPRDRVALKNCIGIDCEKEIAAREPRCCVDRGTAAAARPVANDHVHQAVLARSVCDRTRIVRGAIVDDNNLKW
ncbi:hypothetical protein OFEAOIEE_LOCUS2369 [Methylorubrum extorquens]